MLDASSQDLNQFKALASSVQDKDISIVVNNAGMLCKGEVASEDPKTLESLVNTNGGPYIYLTSLFLPSLKKREKRCALIYTSSVASWKKRPNLSTYAASKTLNDAFAQNLNEELERQETSNADVLSFGPALVASNMVKQEPAGLKVVSAE